MDAVQDDNHYYNRGKNILPTSKKKGFHFERASDPIPKFVHKFGTNMEQIQGSLAGIKVYSTTSSPFLFSCKYVKQLISKHSNSE